MSSHMLYAILTTIVGMGKCTIRKPLTKDTDLTCICLASTACQVLFQVFMQAWFLFTYYKVFLGNIEFQKTSYNTLFVCNPVPESLENIITCTVPGPMHCRFHNMAWWLFAQVVLVSHLALEWPWLSHELILSRNSDTSPSNFPLNLPLLHLKIFFSWYYKRTHTLWFLKLLFYSWNSMLRSLFLPDTASDSRCSSEEASFFGS